MKRSLFFVMAALMLSVSAYAQLAQQHDVSSLTPYKPRMQVTGTIRVYGNNYIPALMKRWEEGFQHFQPGVNFTTDLPGTEAAMAGLYDNRADIVFLGREAYRSEIRGFTDRFGYPPLGIEISSGSFGTPHKTFSLEIFVNASNPLQSMTMSQAEGVFGKAGPDGKPIRTWGQLGVTGPMASHAIHVYGYQFDTGMAGFFNRVVLHDSGQWNDELKDFDNGRDANGEVINAGVYILKALATDPDGIAFANLQYANDHVRAIGLENDEAHKTLNLDDHHGGDHYTHEGHDEHLHPVAASPGTIFDRSYPLHRFTTLYINRPPGKPVDLKVAEFIRYILSREAMQAVADDGAYTPLNEEVAAEQRKKLE